ncbi:MAG: putative lipid II flippase FtsW [Burkholderiales bacterium]|uniref:putative lipid II flippase FtsW n=1 Tax=Inhella sp. TaxID=1921806 RepID=UPI001AD2ED03|nr:putative lipid II flippase FtsW [Burkholderiales bacterium]
MKLPGWQGLNFGKSEAALKLPVRTGVDISDNLHPTRAHGFDLMLVWVVVCLLCLSAVMVYSASIALPDSPKFARYSPTYFFVRQCVGIGVGLLAALVITQIPMKLWEQATPWLLGITLLLLVVVLVVGKGVNGAHRWLPLGVMNFQPSELAKFAIALYGASYMVRKLEMREDFWKSVTPMLAVLGVLGVLLLAQPDMGAFVVIAAIAIGVLFLGGVNLRMFGLVIAVLVTAFVVMIATSEFRRKRILAFLDPWDPENAAGKAYQLTHSLIAFGRGEWFGQGLGGSVEKLHYLPEAHTDFLLAVIGEELGFLGVCLVIVAFFWLTRRCFLIGRQAIALDRVFAGLYAQGIGIWVGGQAFINIGVNLGALPTKGLTLPLLSYGGSAVVMNLFALAVVLRVDLENRALMRGGRA